MADISIIVAMAHNGLIGKDGALPWRIKEDMTHFKDLTMGHPVLMGRKTYESLPDNYRPLPGRENLILTRDKNNIPGYGVSAFNDIEFAVCSYKRFEKLFIAGGSQVYSAFLPLANSMEITWVNGEFEGDTYFPKVDWDKWEKVKGECHPEYGPSGIEFARYERK